VYAIVYTITDRSGILKLIETSEGLVPVRVFRANLAQWFRKAVDTGRPVVVTQHGKAAAVVMSPGAVDDLQEELAFMRAVVKGLRSIEEGRVVDDGQVWSEMDQLIDQAERSGDHSLE